MKNLDCNIEKTVIALEEAIENKKTQMHNAQLQAVSSHSNIVPYVFSEIFKRAGGSYGQIAPALEQGREFAQNFIKKAQKSVEENPWDVLRKVAVSSFGIGLFLSRRHKNHQPRMEEQE